MDPKRSSAHDPSEAIAYQSFKAESSTAPEPSSSHDPNSGNTRQTGQRDRTSASDATISNRAVESNSQINATVTGGVVGVSGAKLVRIENLYVGGPTAPVREGDLQKQTPVPFGPVELIEPFPKASYVQSPAYFFKQGEVIANFGNPREQEFQFNGPRAIYIRVSPAIKNQQPKVGGKKLKTIFYDMMIVKPMSLALGGSVAPNKYGWISIFPSSNNSTNEITQGFMSGELWGLNSSVFKYGLIRRPVTEEAMVFLDAIQAEKICYETLKHYVDLLVDKFELILPFVVEIGVVELENCYLAAPSAEERTLDVRYYGPIMDIIR